MALRDRLIIYKAKMLAIHGPSSLLGRGVGLWRGLTLAGQAAAGSLAAVYLRYQHLSRRHLAHLATRLAILAHRAGPASRAVGFGLRRHSRAALAAAGLAAGRTRAVLARLSVPAQPIAARAAALFSRGRQLFIAHLSPRLERAGLALKAAGGRLGQGLTASALPALAGAARPALAWLGRRGPLGLPANAIAVTTLAIAVASGAYYQARVAPNAWDLLVRGERAAVVAEKGQAEAALRDLLAEIGESQRGDALAGELAYQPVRAEKASLWSQERLKAMLGSRFNLITTGVALRVNGEDKLFLPDEDSARQVLAAIKASYPPPKDGQVQEVRILEDIQLVKLNLKPEQLWAVPAAVAFLKAGRESVAKYKIKEGDTLSGIAYANSLSTADLVAANPGIDQGVLSIGQEINLNQFNPLLNVVVVARREVKEAIPFETKYVADNDLYRGLERVKNDGADGEKRVVYQVVAKNGQEVERKALATEVLKQPEDRVVSRGTRIILASRGSGGSGQLGWPCSGPLTSYYGWRWGEFHSGLDIGVGYDTPVLAAESGKVITANYYGGYGRQVVIDHGDGVSTRYAHLNSYNVKVGQKVERGEVIGFSGSSGRSTGPHLHFEVLINGADQNPLKFLR